MSQMSPRRPGILERKSLTFRSSIILCASGLFVLFIGSIAAKKCYGQAPDSGGSQRPYQQTDQAGQSPATNQNQPPDPYLQNQPPLDPYQHNQQLDPYEQNQSLGQYQQNQQQYQQNQQLDQYQQNQQPDQYQQNGQSTSQGTMSAEQIIGILQTTPEVLSAIKIQVAEQLGVDPSTISDNDIYDRIRGDPRLRDLATRELNQRGYSTNPTTENQPSQNRLNAPITMGTATQAIPGTPSTLAGTYQNPNAPQVQPQPSPYSNMPSLRDLYSQFPRTEKRLRRFGNEAFLPGMGNRNQLPMDLPVGPDYVLGTGDNLTVNMWGGRSGRLSLTIDRQGQIALPEAGTLTVNGLTIDQAQKAIQDALNPQFHDEHVEISLGRLRTVRVYVVGDVQLPGAYDVSSLSTPLSALYAAGGPTSHGSLRILRQFRGDQLVRQIDLYDFLLRGIRTGVDRLLPGDTLLVPPAGEQVSVEGMVRRPAIYELNGEKGLNDVLDLAGGVLASASLKQINVERIQAHQYRSMLSLQLSDNLEGMREKLATFHMQDGDDVIVSQILPYNEKAVYVEGHVYHPGKYPYDAGMTIKDLLHSSQDVMPEASDHAELVRLLPPDFRPKTISFNLSSTLTGNVPIELQPFDLVRVFGRYEMDPPRVSIDGEVLRPGNYPLSQDMTVADLVGMAGGFKRDAYQDQADLTSYRLQSGQVVLDHTVVDLPKALSGDKNADLALKSGDIVSIRQVTGWQDIGASITITGEVGHAGTYGIKNGELLSAVLKRAGGFRETAYPQGAILERVQVRQLGEKARQQMIQRLETTPLNFKPGILSAQDQTAIQLASQQQRDQALAALRSHSASGRLVINISSDIGKWENTPADVEMRPGDSLVIPKQQKFVLVSGQVYNQTAITYAPGKDGNWYLRQAGGPTQGGDKGAIFIVRANGSVIGHAGSKLTSNVLNTRMRPGDTIIVPEKAIGSQVWKNLISAAQIMSSVAITGAVAGIF